MSLKQFRDFQQDLFKIVKNKTPSEDIQTLYRPTSVTQHVTYNLFSREPKTWYLGRW